MVLPCLLANSAPRGTLLLRAPGWEKSQRWRDRENSPTNTYYMNQKQSMENLYTYLRSTITLLPLLAKGGWGITIVLVLGWLVCEYLKYRTKQAEMRPELLRAEGDKAVKMAEAKAIRDRARRPQKGPVRKPLEKGKKTSLGVWPGL